MPTDTSSTTDPEYTAYTTDFADEALQTVALSEHHRLVVRLGATIAVGAPTAFRAVLTTALDAGITPVEVKEVVYQAAAYVGSARTGDFLAVTNAELSARGVALPLPGQSTTDPTSRSDRGLAVQKAIVGGDQVDALYDRAPADTVHFQRFLSANCFGDTVARDGLDLRARELLTFAMLVALGGADAQVRAHVAGNRTVGNSRRDLVDVLTVLVQDIGYPRTLNGLAVVEDAAPATGAEHTDPQHEQEDA